MPELPEVQTIVSDLNKRIVGRKITSVWFDAPKLFKKIKPPDFIKEVVGSKIMGVRRRAKNILIDLDRDRILLVHLKMTGHLLLGKWEIKDKKIMPISPKSLKEKVNGYIHVVFSLNNSQMLGLSDLRKFAKVMLGRREDIEVSKEFRNLGPEPLDTKLVFEEFSHLIGRGRRKIKQVLLDQNVIAGIGNIYSDDILWEARVNPSKIAESLELDQKKAIWVAMKKILRKAIELRGTSVSDYRDPNGERGSYGETRLVYKREKEKCKRCGTEIKRIKIGGRSSCFCPNCQLL